ncbi:MAG: alanine--glyoxylate aminotransferase family protein [Candidatus ainarchaeum sp.]|nr:alanine--glyoxylate aminotransferase family protein [Candidatus ainarchaeum sp.]
MKLFIPGPISVSEEIAITQTKEMISHRSSEFKELMKECSEGLQNILYTKNRVLISTSSGSGFMEGAIRNTVNKKVLVCVCGAFGKKWAQIATSCGKEVTILNFKEGNAINKEELKNALTKNDFEAVCITLNETSTGIENNLEELVPIIREQNNNILILVDAVSGMGGTRIHVDKLGLDVCLASSQKCFALPPGLAFASVSEKVLEKAITIKDRGYYFDFVELAKEYDENQTPYTPAVGLMFALQEQLKLIKKEGIEERFNRHKKLKEITHAWVRDNGFFIFSDEKYSSNTITCINNTKKIDLSKLKKAMITKGYFIDTGYRKLNEKLLSEGKDETFRIPHMGELSEEELHKFLDTLKIIMGEI